MRSPKDGLSTSRKAIRGVGCTAQKALATGAELQSGAHPGTLKIMPGRFGVQSTAVRNVMKRSDHEDP